MAIETKMEEANSFFRHAGTVQADCSEWAA